VTNVLDLRTAQAAVSVGLSTADLTSEVDDYAACQRVARVAHQLELHGILAPAATGLGETLALFERHLPAEEIPVLTAIETWPQLPADPRRLRLVDEQEA
jgi:RES domain-containing protein